MSELLENSTVQFLITIIVGLASVLVPVAVYMKQRRRKALSYEVVSATPLLSVKGELKGKLQILYENKAVQQVHLILVRIFNSGNIPIEQGHYDRHIRVSFGEEAQVLTAEVTETSPDSLRASIAVEGKEVALTPILLNGSDSVTLKMLVSRFADVTIDGRIVGVREIQKFKKKPVLSACFLIGGFILVLAFLTGIVGFALTLVGINIGIFVIEPEFFVSCFLAGYGLILIGFVLDPAERRRFQLMFRGPPVEES